jgi:hypothetical protein
VGGAAVGKDPMFHGFTSHRDSKAARLGNDVPLMSLFWIPELRRLRSSDQQLCCDNALFNLKTTSAKLVSSLARLLERASFIQKLCIVWSEDTVASLNFGNSFSNVL